MASDPSSFSNEFDSSPVDLGSKTNGESGSDPDSGNDLSNDLCNDPTLQPSFSNVPEAAAPAGQTRSSSQTTREDHTTDAGWAAGDEAVPGTILANTEPSRRFWGQPERRRRQLAWARGAVEGRSKVVVCGKWWALRGGRRLPGPLHFTGTSNRSGSACAVTSEADPWFGRWCREKKDALDVWVLASGREKDTSTQSCCSGFLFSPPAHAPV